MYLQWNVHNGKLIGALEVVVRKKSVGFNPRIIARAIMMTSHPVVLFRLRYEKRLICCWKTMRAKSLQNCEHQCLWKAIKRQKQIKLSNFDSPDHLQGRVAVVILYNSVVLIRLYSQFFNCPTDSCVKLRMNRELELFYCCIQPAKLMLENPVVTHAVSSSCHVWNKKDEELRAEQTNQITKAHRIINSSTSLCFLELVCVRESGETLQICIIILKYVKQNDSQKWTAK